MRSSPDADRASRYGFVITTTSSLRSWSGMDSNLGHCPLAPELIPSKNISQPATASRDSWTAMPVPHGDARMGDLHAAVSRHVRNSLQ